MPRANDLRLRRTATIRDVREIVVHHLKALWADPMRAAALPPLMISGPPGIGKSAIIREVCEKEGIEFLDVRLAQREPVDIRGLPVPRDDGVHWLTSAEWPRDGRGIILFDELTAADRSLQVAAYEFILDRRLGDLYRVPDGWYIAAAGNRGEDRAVALTMSSALANRFCHLEVEADIEDWTRWAARQGVHPLVIGFLRFQPRLLFANDGDREQGWPTPRAWERVGFELEVAERTALPERTLALVVQGLVGAEAASEFLAYRGFAGELTKVERMLRGEEPVEAPERLEQRYALVTAAVHFAQSDARLLSGLIRLSLALPPDFATLCLIDYLGAADPGSVSARAEALFGCPEFPEWQRRHGAAFRARFASLGAGDLPP
ncbi:MAG: hypothetical protein JW751_22640 [Polyangiaceae bacterium]|nr:hypothetical protein [Polyangiaceae bacterium]